MILVREEQSDLGGMENEEMDECVQDTPTELLKMKRITQYQSYFTMLSYTIT